MDWKNIKAASVKINVDYKKLTQELEDIPNKLWDSGVDRVSDTYWNTIWLRKNNVKVFEDFKSAKCISHSEWGWREDLNIPYIQSLIESLPVKTIGMIRAFILNGPLVMHVDSNETTPTDISYNMALTIASKLETPMSMGNNVKVKEQVIFFNDSIPHGFPDATDRQISIRVFGDFDYNKFDIQKVYR